MKAGCHSINLLSFHEIHFHLYSTPQRCVKQPHFLEGVGGGHRFIICKLWALEWNCVGPGNEAAKPTKALNSMRQKIIWCMVQIFHNTQYGTMDYCILASFPDYVLCGDTRSNIDCLDWFLIASNHIQILVDYWLQSSDCLVQGHSACAEHLLNASLQVSISP